MAISEAGPLVPSLTLLNGPEAGRRVPLTTGRSAVIGRSLEADLTFPDEPSLSRLHVRIEHAGGHYTVTDLDSANGTRLNGKDVKGAIVLAHGDIVTCGALEFRFDLPQGRRRSATTPLSMPLKSSAIPTEPRITAIVPAEGVPALQSPPAHVSAAQSEHMAGAAPNHGGPAAVVATAGTREEKPAIHAGGDAPRSRVPGTIPDGRKSPRTPSRAPKTQPAPTRSKKHGEQLSPAETDSPVVPLKKALQSVPLFRQLSAELLADIAASMTERGYPAGADIVSQGDDGYTLFVVLAGQARVHRAGAAGEDVELAMLGPRGFFGEMSLLDGQPRSATVRAMTDVRCALLPRWALESAITAHPVMALQILAVLSTRLRAVERMFTA